MRDGVFTQIIYQAQGAQLVTPDREVLLFGIPLRVLKSARLMSWVHDENSVVAANATNKLKTDPDDKINAVGDIKLYIRKASETIDNAVEIVQGTDVGEFFTAPTVSVDNYNSAGGAAAITFLATDGLKRIQYNGGGLTVTITIGSDDLVTVSGDDASTLMDLLENGQCITPDSSTFYPISSVNPTALTFEAAGITAGEGTGAMTPWIIYYDYEGDSVSANRSPVITFDVTAQRSGVSGLYTITEVQDLIDLFDESSLSEETSNLGFSAMLQMAANGNVNKFRIYALTADGSNTIATILANSTAWLAALDATKGISGSYHLVPLTDNETIYDIFKAHVVAMSATEEKNERRIYISEKILNSGDGYQAGDTEGELFVDTSYDAQTDVDLAVQIPATYNSDRVILIGPYYAKMGTTMLYGYHIAAIVAGWISSLELGYSVTNDSIPLIDYIPSIDYFTKTQMESLKDSGWFMLHQTIAGGAVKCYHQYTTEQELLEKKEQSLPLAIDALAQAVRATLDPYIARGISNRTSPDFPGSTVTQRYLKKLNGALSSLRHYYTNNKEIIADFKVIGVTPNTTNKDQTDIKLEVSHYYPVNRINTTIYVV
jgi:hypothetical protein